MRETFPVLVGLVVLFLAVLTRSLAHRFGEHLNSNSGPGLFSLEGARCGAILILILGINLMLLEYLWSTWERNK
jgi:hypothetical protein